jgi:predicted  nucleic acid-binding Zn-ribbon protein
MLNADTSVPQKLPGANDHEKLQALSALTYPQQAVWFLNGFWHEHDQDAELMWNWVQTFAKFDLQNGVIGTGLDELNAHRLLEQYQETMTVQEMRTKMRSTGALEANERPKYTSLIHIAIVKYGLDWHTLVNASQGSNPAELKKAQHQLEVVREAFEKCRVAEAPFKAAQEEVESALREVHSQEEAYHGKIADAERRSEEGGAVSRGKASAELAQLKAEDPLPLRKAKVTLGAAQKRAEKARAPFLEAREAAEAAFNEAQAFLDEISKKGGSPLGSIFWLNRQLHEQKKYQPEKKRRNCEISR